MRNVRRLVMDLRTYEKCRYYCSPQLLHICRHLLAQMTQLESLEFNSQDEPKLPPLLRLKHLEITIDHMNSGGDLLVSLSALPALETLHVKKGRLSILHIVDAEVEELLLDSSLNLKAVCLEGILPVKIQLPPTAKLSVAAHASYGIEHTFAALFRACHGLRLHGTHQSDCLETLLARGAPYLTALSFHHAYLGEDLISFGGSLPHLRSLSLTATHAKIKLALPNLCALVLDFDANLELEVEDLAAFGERLETLYLRWQTSGSMDAIWANLQALSRPQRRFKRQSSHRRPARLGYNEVNYFSSGWHTVSLNMFPEVKIGPCDFASSPCGACMGAYCSKKASYPQNLKYPLPIV